LEGRPDRWAFRVIMMNCRKTIELSTDYLNGALSPQLRGELARHIQECESCHSEIRGMENAVQLLGRFENRRLTRDFDNHLFQRLDSLSGGRNPGVVGASGGLSPISDRLRGWMHSPWRWAATAAALAGVGLASWQFYPGPTHSGQDYIQACVQAHATFEQQPPRQHVLSVDAGPDLDLPDVTTD